MSDQNDLLYAASAAPAANKADLAILARSHVTAGQARLSRLIGRGYEAALGDGVLQLQLASDAVPQWNDMIVLAGSFGEIECEDGARLLRALTGIEPATVATGEAQAAWLNAAIVGRLGATPFARTDRLLREPLAPAADTITARLVLRSAQHTITTHVRSSAETWLAFLQDTAWTQQCAEQALFADLPFDAPVCIARHTLPAQAASTLATGDIIVPDSPAFACNGTGQIRLGSTSARVRYEAPSSLYIISTETNMDNYELDDEHDGFDGEADYLDEEDGAHGEEHAEEREEEYADEHDESHTESHDDDYGDEDEEPAAAGDAAPVQSSQQLDRVPLTLDFELGKVRMNLGKLRALATGTVIEIEGGSPSLITVRAGGRKLGTGEIVDVDGRLGIRLTDWRA